MPDPTTTVPGQGSESNPADSSVTEDLNNTVWKSPSDSWQSKVDEAGGGGQVIVEPGDHGAPSSQVDLPSANGEGITIKGFGKGSKVKVPSGGTLFKATGGANYDTDNNISGHHIEGLFFYQDSWSNRGDKAIEADGLIQANILNNWFKRLTHGIWIDDTNGHVWADTISGNEFEIVQRPIRMQNGHDCRITDNHGEGISGAASISSFDDTVGDAAGIYLKKDCQQVTVANNGFEEMKDDGGEGKGIWLENVQDNIILSGNVVKASDRESVITYDTNPVGNSARIIFIGNDMDIDNSVATISGASSTEARISIFGHNGRLINFTYDFDELYMQIVGGDFQQELDIAGQVGTRGRLVISGVGGEQSSQNQPPSLNLANLKMEEIIVSDTICRELVINNSGTASDVAVVISGITISDDTSNGILFQNDTYDKVVVTGVTDKHDSGTGTEMILVGSNATVSNLAVSAAITTANSIVTAAGTVTTQAVDTGSTITGA